MGRWNRRYSGGNSEQRLRAMTVIAVVTCSITLSSNSVLKQTVLISRPCWPQIRSLPSLLPFWTLLLLLLLLLLALQSLVDFSLFLEASQQHIFLWGGIVSPTSNPKQGGPWCSALSGSSPVWHGNNWATASISLTIIWPYKPHHYVKVGITLGAFYIHRTNNVWQRTLQCYNIRVLHSWYTINSNLWPQMAMLSFQYFPQSVTRLKH